MIINKEFFFRGWLPAGLLINARMATDAPEGSVLPVLKPVINPYPGSGWPNTQPYPVFPIDQATEDAAIILMDRFPEGTLVMQITRDWMGSGTPYILAVNTWYEGRIRSVTGSDVMAVRITNGASEDYYSHYSDVASRDVRVYNFPCKHILGTNSEQIMLLDADGATMATEDGYPPTILSGDQPQPVRIVDVLRLSSMSYAGMLTVYSDKSPANAMHVVMCTVQDGRHPGDPIKTVALAAAPKVGRQNFYQILEHYVLGEKVNVIGTEQSLVTVASSRSIPGTEQVVHYN